MISRTITKHLKYLFSKYPIITITGPRQSGKTTLVKELFKKKPYLNLENIETRTIANSDPVGFINNLKSSGAVIDEIQRVPNLLSQIQVTVDDTSKNGMFILTGSQNFTLLKNISQSLAGRTAIVNLLPLSVHELRQHKINLNWYEQIYYGGYPRIFDQNINPSIAMSDYFLTYVEKDIRQLKAIHNLSLFEKFIKLCAGRVGQLLDLTSISNETGVSRTTINNWISLLQTTYIIFLLEPYYTNINKRLVKTPKIYFYDTALASYLLGIENELQLKTHPLTGNLFENLVVSEFYKYRLNNGKNINLNFYRDSKKNEIDLIYKVANKLFPIEIKSSETFNNIFFKGFNSAQNAGIKFCDEKFLVYNGQAKSKVKDLNLINISDIDKYFKDF